MRFGLFLSGAVAVLALCTAVGCGRAEPTSPSSATAKDAKTDVSKIEISEANEGMLVGTAQANADHICDGIVPQDAATLALYGKACKMGDGESCAKLGFLYMCGAGVEKNGPVAMSLIEKSCGLKNPEGCQLEAGLLIAGTPGMVAKRDVHRALEIYQRSCDNGIAKSCGTLGTIMMIVGDSSTRSFGLLERSCTLGNEDACGNIAVIEMNGMEGHPKNMTRAVSLAKASCEKQNPFSCTILGSMHMTGTGVAKDEVAAAKLFTFACNGNDAMGCMFLGVCNAQGIGLEQNLQVAGASLKKGCDGGNAQACRFLAEMSGVPTASAPATPTSSMSGAANPTLF